MSQENDIAQEINEKSSQFIRALSLKVNRDVINMTPVDTGNLAENVKLRRLPPTGRKGEGFRVSNNQPYAEKVYLEGWSVGQANATPPLPRGQFQAYVARIPKIADKIAKKYFD